MMKLLLRTVDYKFIIIAFALAFYGSFVMTAHAYITNMTDTVTGLTATGGTLTLTGDWDMGGIDPRSGGSGATNFAFNPNSTSMPYPTISWPLGTRPYGSATAGAFSFAGPVPLGSYNLYVAQTWYWGPLSANWIIYIRSVRVGNPPVVSALLDGAPNDIAVAAITTPFTLQVTGTNNPTTCYMSKYTNGVSGAWAAYPCATYASPMTVSAQSLGLNPGLNRVAFYMSNAIGNSSSVTRTITVPSSVPPPDVTFLLNGMPNNITVASSTIPFTLQITGTNSPVTCYKDFAVSHFSFGLTSYPCETYSSATTTTAGALGLRFGTNILSAYMSNAVGVSPTVSRTVTVGFRVPTVSSPTSASIGIDSAVLGATVVSDGGSSLTSRGVCWGLSGGSSALTNCNSEGNTSLGTFSELQSGLPINTQIYFRGYATNGVGTGYSSTANFRTLSIPACTGVVVSNATPYTGDTTGLSASLAYVYAGSDTARKCEYSCNSGYVWNGSRCVMSAIIPADPVLTVTPRIVEEGTEATLSWDTNNGNETLCSIAGGTLGATLVSLPSTSGDAETGSYTLSSITALTTYTLTCGALSDTATIEIVPRGFET